MGNDPSGAPTGYSAVTTPDAVRAQLVRILDSPAFRYSKRSADFLKLIVERALEGRQEELKERYIGAAIFGRPLDYDTPGDAIVRVKAHEIRKRLAQYYRDTDTHDQLVIELPTGSYVPVFLWRSNRQLSSDPPPARRSRALRVACLVVAGLALVSGGIYLGRRSPSELEALWLPLTGGNRPVLVVVGTTPPQYNVSARLKRIVQDLRPGTAITVPLRGDDVVARPYESVSVFGVRALLNIQGYLATHGSTAKLRIADQLSFEQLTSQSMVFIGAFDNLWTLSITREARFTFARQGNAAVIRDQANPDEAVWLRKGTPPDHDYALLTRVFDRATGQVYLSVAGIEGHGTEVAAEYITNPRCIRDLAASAPSGWARKNFQVVLETRIIADTPRPPRVLATHFW